MLRQASGLSKVTTDFLAQKKQQMLKSLEDYSVSEPEVE
jgi:hypothetical protein